MKIADGVVVTLEYVLTDEAGTPIDTSAESGPLTYVHGEKRIIPGLERALVGRNEGEHFTVVVPPDQAYGWHDPDRVEWVPRTALDPAGEVQVGMRFESQTPKGIVVATVIALQGDDARVDANHPLAGKELHFDVRVITVRAPTRSTAS
jgi:FKBP-type peptidyl-prolyl cis-trans isomerase SlyD